MIIRKRTSVVVPGTTWRVCASVDFVFRRYKEAAAGRRADAEQATSVAAHKDKTKKEILFYGSYTTYSMVLTPSGFLHPPILWFLHQHIHTLNRHHEATWGKTTLTFFLRFRIHLFSSHISTLDRKHNSHNKQCAHTEGATDNMFAFAAPDTDTETSVVSFIHIHLMYVVLQLHPSWATLHRIHILLICGPVRQHKKT